MNKKKTTIRKAILLPDIHHPHHDRPSMRAVEEFMTDNTFDELIYMGDQMHLDCISSWTKEKPLLREQQRLLKDYKNFDKDILKRHEELTPKASRRIFMIGNHEQRVQWRIEKDPELEGVIDIDTHLKLTERGYEIIPYNNIYKLGKLNIIHGFYWNKYHAAKTVDAFEGSVAYAHVHNPQMHFKVSPVDRKGYHMATCLPCLCTVNPDYKKNAPNHWVNGLGTVEWNPTSGFYTLYSIIIINGKFRWNGKEYGKR